MRKSILRFGALALMSMMSIGSWAEGVIIGHSFYNLKEDGTATLISASLSDTWTSDWSTVKNGTGDAARTYVVTEVSEKAFSDVTGPVTIPSTLQKIGKEAFKGKTIIALGDAQPIFNFPAYVELGEGAFENATFPEGTIINLGGRESLPIKIFKAQVTGNNIMTVTCTGLTEIPESAFDGCKQLKFFGSMADAKYYLPAGLTNIGAKAFKGCTSLVYFNFNHPVPNKESQIKYVGEWAFQDCEWMNNTVFENVCWSFAGLTYGEGSFSGCGLTSVDLTGSTVTVTEKLNDTESYTGIGVPANAFYRNNIEFTNSTKLVLPEKCVVIGKGAFQNNNTLTIPTLPESLEYIGADAFKNNAGEKIEQGSLYLPNDFVKIGTTAFGNRTITTVYAQPEFNTEKRSVPTLDASNSESIANTVVPVVAPWTPAGGSSTNVKEQYTNKGWSSVRYATIRAVAPTTVTFDNVEYTIGEQAADGVYPVTPKQYNAANITIPGMFNKTSSIQSEADNKYDVFFKVVMPNDANVVVQNGVSVSSLTFSPKEMKGTAAAAGFSGASYTEIPTFAAGECNTTLTTVVLNEGVTNVAANAFKDFNKLNEVALCSINQVGNYAFNGIKASTIALPATLQTFGTAAFGGTNLKTVQVQYLKQGAGKTIPTPASGVFGTNAKNLQILEGGTATRYDYMTKNDGGADPTYYWAQFFETTTSVQVKTTAFGAALTKIASVDKLNDDGTLAQRVFELSDANDIAEVKITGAPETGDNIPAVKYTRTFNNANYQAWFVPFDYTYTGNEDCEFYYIYDTKQDGFGTDATTTIELKKVANGKIIKANTPYVVKSNEAKAITFESNAIKNTEHVDVTFGNVQNQFTFKGIYAQKEKTTGEGSDWYALMDGTLFNYNNTEFGLNAYRFYMTYVAQGSAPYQFIKFNVLDDEDATAIENVKAGSLNAPMFDLMGRQIAAPAKGQVYIQNGVKKLAK